MFSKILIANRGEIAVCIIRACKEMGIATVAVYSEADRDALHVALADERYCLGPAASEESYLHQRRIITAAQLAGAQAIHPGYGFLFENAHFAGLCQRNGLAFVGPRPETMDALGDKAAIKRAMAEAGLTPIPGTDALPDEAAALSAAEEIGYPVMLKARSGGGGRGIRLVRDAEALSRAYPQAVAEATAAFGDGAVYLEKYVAPARHIEVQVLADEAGNAVCLGERDCSVQRRNQKLAEETPSPAVSAGQRAELMRRCARAVAKIGYVGAGTLEFLLDEQGRFWFMEMNVRLQVEHSVTEMLTRIDLVKWQIRIAAGIPLGFRQEDVPTAGAALECRINAKACGRVTALHVPGGPSVRFDTCLTPGTTVPPHYDSLVGKLVVYAGTRDEALRKMRAALCELVIEGVPTNAAEQLTLLEDERFARGDYDLTLMEGR